MKKLPDSELEVMLEIWNSDKPLCCYELRDIFQGRTNWAVTTVSTMLSRLEAKGFISYEKKGKTKYFSPVISKEEYAQNYSRNILEKFFGNSLQNFVACLASSKDVSKEELDDLRKFLDEQK